MTQPSITQQRMAAIFNEWARLYAQNPDDFGEILDADGSPVEDYGHKCAIYFCQIAYDMDSKGLLPLPMPNACVQELEAAQAQRTPLSAEAIAEIAERFEVPDPDDSFWVELCRAFEGASVTGITQEKHQ